MLTAIEQKVFPEVIRVEFHPLFFLGRNLSLSFQHAPISCGTTCYQGQGKKTRKDYLYLRFRGY